MGFASSIIRVVREAISGPSQESRTSVQNGRRAIDLSDGWLRLSDPDFFGEAHTSANGNWALGCDDSDGDGSGGCRENGNGRVVLVDVKHQSVVHELMRFERPVDAAVSDTGLYVLHDCRFGSGLQADIAVVDVEGREQFRHHYDANVFNIGISSCGRYAAVQTANSPNDDGNRLDVLNIPEQRVCLTIRPKGGWAKDYGFEVDEEGRLLSLRVELLHLGWFTYSRSGNFLDEAALRLALIENSQYSTVLGLVRDRMNTDDSEPTARDLLNTVDGVLRRSGLDGVGVTDVAHRLRGELLERLARPADALAAYENALALNSKVGAKVRAMRIRKELEASKTA
jgi:hypothetical protein